MTYRRVFTRCTNYGMAFTKSGDPTDTKFAMIDRSISHLVRSIGKQSHDDSEFLRHIEQPEQRKKVTRFRIFVCLVGATKLAIKGVPDFQPSFALANKMFDYLDNEMINTEYNMPRCTPRKALKRDGNLATMCIMKAVADVFMNKQTAVEFEPGRPNEDGSLLPFKFTMLYDVIRQLRVTPELMFVAWSQSLDFNIGTSTHAMAAATALCEHCSLKIGDWMKRPIEGVAPTVQAPGSPSASRSAHRSARLPCTTGATSRQACSVASRCGLAVQQATRVRLQPFSVAVPPMIRRTSLRRMCSRAAVRAAASG